MNRNNIMEVSLKIVANIGDNVKTNYGAYGVAKFIADIESYGKCNGWELQKEDLNG